MKKPIFILFFLICTVSTVFSAQRYVGGDISLLPNYEKAESKYYDHEGNDIADVLKFCYDEGLNAMRVRLFVNPDDYTGPDKDPNACQSLDYILPLCKRIKADGYALMLDFHYSDTWADPAKQWTPKSWASLSDEQLATKINSYTKEVLETLKENDCTPDFIQTGNEISYGLCWGLWNDPASSLKKCFTSSNANWDRFLTLLKNAINACREVCPQAKIVLHTERVAQPDVLVQTYQRFSSLDYDIIGLSYYPYYHGPLSNLKQALERLTKDFPSKNIMIVETGYPYKWAIKGDYDISSTFPYTEEGQAKFTKELVDLLLNYEQVNGLFWWWLEYNAYGTNLEGWYNAPLWDSTTGKATLALKELASFRHTASVSTTTIDNADIQWFDLSGNKVKTPHTPGIYVNSRGEKIMIRN